MFKEFFNQLFCKHEWVNISNFPVQVKGHHRDIYRCQKCYKIKYMEMDEKGVLKGVKT